MRIRGGAAHGGGYLARSGRRSRRARSWWPGCSSTPRPLRWAGIVLGGLALAFLVHGWWSLFFTVLVVGLFEAAVSFAVARGRSDAAGPALTVGRPA